MTDEFLIEPEDVTDLVLRGVERPLPSQLRGDPRFVEPVRVELDADPAAVRETVEQLRDELYATFGFVPREIEVAPGASGWKLFIDGDVVEHSPTLGRDARGELLAGLSRHLWRMLRVDDVAELVEFARAASPVAVGSALPAKFSIEQLHRVLYRLLRDGVPIKPLDRIIEVMAETPHHARETEVFLERVRLAKRRWIIGRARQSDGALRVLELSVGARNACEHLRLEPVQPDNRRRRFLERMRRDIEGARAEFRLDPVVVVVPTGARAAVASTFRSLDVQVVSHVELVDTELQVVDILGRGIRVPSFEPPAPPSPSEGMDWNWGPGANVAVVQSYSNVVDVEVID